MESLNVVILSGILQSRAKLAKLSLQDAIVDAAILDIRTVRVSRTSGHKEKIEEVQKVYLINPGTIFDYLTQGKPIIAKGKLASDSLGDQIVLAESVTFPAQRLSNE